MENQRHRVIAKLLHAGRPDLANQLAYARVSYWEQEYRRLNNIAQDLQKKIRFWARENEKVQGRNAIVYRNLSKAGDLLDSVMANLKALRQGIGLKPLTPHEVPRVPRAA